jgi:hypothetical protein
MRRSKVTPPLYQRKTLGDEEMAAEGMASTAAISAIREARMRGMLDGIP